MAIPLRVLILEDRPADAELMLHELRQAGFDADWQRVETEPDYLAALEMNPDLILADWSLPQFSGLRALRLMNEHGLDIPFVIVSGSIGEEAAVEAMRQGAADYLLKDRLTRLGVAVATVLKERKLRGQRHRARETLKETDQFLTGLIQASPLAIILTDSSWRIRSWNQAAERLFGWSAREAVDRPLSRVLGGSREEFRALGKQLVRGELLDGVDLRQHRKDGSPIDVSLWGTALYGGTGRVHRILAIIADITGRKRAEEELRQSQEKFFKAFRASPDWMSISVLEEGRFIEVNDAFIRISGFQREEVIGHTVGELTLWADPDLRRELVQTVKKDRSIHGREVSIRMKSGEIRDMLWSAELISFGGESCLISIFSDITERKRAEESLRRSEERFRILFDFAPDAYYLNEFDGTMVDGNRVAEEMTGYTRNELIGRNFLQLGLLREDQVEKAAGLLVASASGKPTGPDELVLVRRDGIEVPVEIRTVPMKIGDQHLVLGIARDITTRKRAEEELRASMDRLRKAMGGTVRAMALTVESRDPYTAGHQQRVANLARAIAQEMGLPRDRVDGIRMAGVIHDVGKVSVPAEILSKPGRITEIEFSIIKTHAQVGYDILKNIDFPWPIADMVLQHHEKMNGTGYPSGLSGDAIMPEARVLVVADVVEAMVSHRPYRPALGIDSALDEIRKNRGVLYDGDAVDACLRLFEEKGFEFG